MEHLRGQAFIHEKLRRLYRRFVVAALLFFVCLSSAILFDKYHESLQETVDKLYKLKGGFSRVDMAIKEINAWLPDISATIPSDIFRESSEKYLYIGLDEVQMRVGNADISLAVLENKDDELRLPVVITGPLADYQRFVSNVGYLESMRFPFFAFTNLSVSRQEKEGANVVLYEIQGVLTVPKAGKQPDKPNAGKDGS